MAIKTYTKANETAQWSAAEVEAHLRALGFLIGPAGVGTAIDVANGVAEAVVRVDVDANIPQATLDAALDGFTPSDDPVASAQIALRVAAYRLRNATPETTVEERLEWLTELALAYAVTQGV